MVYTGKGTTLIDFFCLFPIEVLNSTSCHYKTYCKATSGNAQVQITSLHSMYTWVKCGKSGDQEDVPGGDGGDSSGRSEPQSSEELFDPEDVEPDDDDLSFWSLPFVNDSSCRFKQVHT